MLSNLIAVLKPFMPVLQKKYGLTEIPVLTDVDRNMQLSALHDLAFKQGAELSVIRARVEGREVMAFVAAAPGN